MLTRVAVCYTSEVAVAVQEAVGLINDAQASWILEMRKALPETVEPTNTREPHNLANEIGKSVAERPLIYVTHEPFTDRWFSHEFRGISVISTSDFIHLATGFPVISYVIYQMAQGIVSFAIGMDEHELAHICHDPAIGCLLDLCSYKPDIRLGMAAGALCRKCHERLLELGASEKHLADMTRILNIVARSATDAEGTNGTGSHWKPEMVSILHISDLHFGGSFRFQPRMIKSGPPPVFQPFGSLTSLSELIGSDLERIATDPQLPIELRALASRVDIVVLSGDIANSGGRDKALPMRENGPTDEYEQAAEFFDDLIGKINVLRRAEGQSPITPSERVVAVPGNHDVNWDEPADSSDRFLGFAKFWRRITGSRAYFDCPPNEIMFRSPINVDGSQIAIVGFNSCTVTSEPVQLRNIGLVEDAQLGLCERFLEGLSVPADRRIAVFHHHPIYIPALAAGVEDYDAMLQAGKLLSYLQEQKFDLILHGHKHYPIAWVHNMMPYEALGHGSWSEPVVVSSGSLSVGNGQLPSSVPNTYQLIGVRKTRDPLRPPCVIVRRRFRRGDTLYGARFEPDGVAYLGKDSLSQSEREKRLSALTDQASPAGRGASLHRERAERYQETGGWMLVHRYRASNAPDQEYDISVYLVEKESKTEKFKRKAVAFVSYAVGELWRGSPFTVTDPKNGFELKLSAYGPFLCIAEVHFRDGSTCRLERFIDFEMANT